MHRLLIVKTTSMGDVIHALPVLHDLKAQWPQLQIDWMVEAPFADLVRANERVVNVVPVSLRTWRKQGPLHVWRQWKLLRASLAHHPYDWVIDLQGLLKSALLARAARGPKAGPGWGYAKESLACLFYGRKGRWDPEAHAVERLRQLTADLLGYRLAGPPIFYMAMDKRQIRQQLMRLGEQRGEVWFLHATAREEKKWPVVRWRELAHRFSDRGFTVCLPWGSEAEREQAVAIAKDIAQVTVLPRMNLAELQQRLQLAHLVVGVDTGITHLAAALYLPLVALFFATPAWRFAPRFNPNGLSVGDLGRMPEAGEVYEACLRLERGSVV